MHPATTNLGAYGSTENLIVRAAYSKRLAQALAVVIAAVAVVNTWLFSSYAATPIVQADAWYFIESFISHYYDHTLNFSEFFVQRGAGDHAQPIQKLVLLFHTRYFDMDFRVEGLIGVGFATIVCFLVMSQMPSGVDRSPRNIVSALLLGCIPAFWLSINATNIYTWSLVTIGFSAQVFACAFLLLYFRLAESGNRAWLFPAAMALGFVIDELAIVAIAVATLAALISGIANWRRVAIATAISIGGLLLARVGLSMLAEELGTSSTAIQVDRVDWSKLFSADAWAGLAAPVSSSFIYIEHLQKWFPNSLNAATATVTLFIASLHVYFWASVYRMRLAGDRSRQFALAIGLMLLAYLLTLGIIVSRVPEFGWSYLYQPRYVVFYQIAMVAILVLLHRRVVSRAAAWVSGRFETLCIGGLAVMLLCSQFVISRSSWQLVPYLTPYWQNASFALGSSVDHPEVRPEQCPASYDFCNYAPARRAALVKALKDQNLNVFSPRFQARNRLYPDANSIPGFNELEKSSVDKE